jgi:hypothetical protein
MPLCTRAECDAEYLRWTTNESHAAIVGVDAKNPCGTTSHCTLQAVVNYVAMTPDGRIFDSSVEKGKPYDIRVGAGQVRRHTASASSTRILTISASHQRWEKVPTTIKRGWT